MKRLRKGEVAAPPVETKALKMHKKITLCLSSIITAFAANATPAFAAPSITQKVETLLGEAFIWAVAIATPIYALSIVGGLLFMIVKGKRGKESGWNHIQVATLAYVAILCLGGIIGLIQNVTDGLGFLPN